MSKSGEDAVMAAIADSLSDFAIWAMGAKVGDVAPKDTREVKKKLIAYGDRREAMGRAAATERVRMGECIHPRCGYREIVIQMMAERALESGETTT